MTGELCVTIRFLHPHPQFHGRRDGEQLEWPPSPMRLYQALLNAACLRMRGRSLPPDVRRVFEWLETSHPRIMAPGASVSTVGYRVYVPHNQFDLVAAERHRGDGEWSKSFRKLAGECRTDKDVRSIRIEAAGETLPGLHYLYPLDNPTLDPQELLSTIRPSVRAITHLGWGIDQVAGDAAVVESSGTQTTGERWSLAARGGTRLRVPRSGSLDELTRRHDQFLNRLRGRDWTPVAPLSMVDHLYYRRDTDAVGRPYVVFKLLDENDDSYTHPHAKLVHLAGMDGTWQSNQ